VTIWSEPRLQRDLPELTKHFFAAWENRNRDQSYMKILRRTGGENNNGASGGAPQGLLFLQSWLGRAISLSTSFEARPRTSVS